MALDPSRVGVTYPSYTYEVSREKIREYARALGETDARYFSDGPDAVAPPTFAAVFTIEHGGRAVLEDPELGAHSSLVHGSQAYELGARPIRPGDLLVCTPRITDLRSRGGSDFLTFEVDCRFDDSGEPAVRSTTMFVFFDPDEAAETDT
jgi:hypothetical protein